MANFKQSLTKIVKDAIGDNNLDSLSYNPDNSYTLRGIFVLLNILEAQKRHIRFRFDLYSQYTWSIEHIASQTDNPLTKSQDRKEWLELAKQEITDGTTIDELDKQTTFEDKWNYVINYFEKKDDTITEKDSIDNLTLLDASTNSAYKNAIFPAKRRKILDEARKADKYIPPITEAVFAKTYSPAASQMRYWGKIDAESYFKAMKEMFNNFMEGTK